MAIFEVLNNQQSYFNRYFRRNVGDDDYATIPEVVLAGDFSVSTRVLTTTTGVESICGDGNGFANYVALNVSGNDLQVRVNNIPVNFTAPSINDGTLHDLVINRDANNNVTATLGGAALAGGGVAAGPFKIELLYANDAPSNHLSGILANLKIYDNGTLVRDYPLNEPKGTSVVYDLVGGNNGAIVNGDDEDKGLFTQQANGDWKGNDLDVPPWDSVDQTLVIA